MQLIQRFSGCVNPAALQAKEKDVLGSTTAWSEQAWPLRDVSRLVFSRNHGRFELGQEPKTHKFSLWDSFCADLRCQCSRIQKGYSFWVQRVGWALRFYGQKKIAALWLFMYCQQRKIQSQCNYLDHNCKQRRCISLGVVSWVSYIFCLYRAEGFQGLKKVFSGVDKTHIFVASVVAAIIHTGTHLRVLLQSVKPQLFRWSPSIITKLVWKPLETQSNLLAGAIRAMSQCILRLYTESFLKHIGKRVALQEKCSCVLRSLSHFVSQVERDAGLSWLQGYVVAQAGFFQDLSTGQVQSLRAQVKETKKRELFFGSSTSVDLTPQTSKEDLEKVSQEVQSWLFQEIAQTLEEVCATYAVQENVRSALCNDFFRAAHLVFLPLKNKLLEGGTQLTWPGVMLLRARLKESLFFWLRLVYVKKLAVYQKEGKILESMCSKDSAENIWLRMLAQEVHQRLA